MINSYTYKIGITAGCYPLGARLTDTLLGIGKVNAILIDSQAYNKGFTQYMDICTLDYSGLITPNDGDVMTIIFEQPIILKIA